jgi:hypothetical protein
MRRVSLRSFALVVTLVLAMLVPVAGIGSRTLLAQTPEATPEPTGCVASTPIADTGEEFPPGLARESSRESLATVEASLQVAIASVICIAPDTDIVVQGSQDIVMPGLSAATIIEGQLNVTLVKACAQPVGCTTGGSARVGRVASNNVVFWTELTVGGPTVILKLGDVIILENVTVRLRSGPDGAVVGSVGSFTFQPGSGCPASCWQFP